MPSLDEPLSFNGNSYSPFPFKSSFESYLDDLNLWEGVGSEKFQMDQITVKRKPKLSRFDHSYLIPAIN